jgi:hypothetical protein
MVLGNSIFKKSLHIDPITHLISDSSNVDELETTPATPTFFADVPPYIIEPLKTSEYNTNPDESEGEDDTIFNIADGPTERRLHIPICNPSFLHNDMKTTTPIESIIDCGALHSLITLDNLKKIRTQAQIDSAFQGS